MEKETPYSERDHTHCFDQEVSPCGLKGKHPCCLCGKETPTEKMVNALKENTRLVSNLPPIQTPTEEWENQLQDFFDCPLTPLGLKNLRRLLKKKHRSLLTSHNAELARKIEGMKRDAVFVPDLTHGALVCRACGQQEECTCATYNQALDAVLALLTNKKEV